ncbi:MAG: chemotaxis protein CheW [Gallionellaceae bacterium]|nr:MAG: chemotaxis protein CheW [Gallionellaceae bacterium]
MATYEGIDVDQELVELIRMMGKAEEYRERLQALQSVWDSLTLLGHLSGTATDMSDTRTAFQELSGGLLNQLARATLKKATLAMKSKARVAVDIMVRNLFERTADIGFLAMDDDVREYLAKFAPLRSRVVGEEERLELERYDAALLARFREYVQKYSVYANIILLDVGGNALLQLDWHNPVRNSKDALIAESLSTAQAYVETFRHSDLLPNESNSLIYSYRVTTADGKNNLGVLCLCFRFANEAERIFANLVEEKDWSVVTLLDRRGTVIASSDAFHVPVGAAVKFQLEKDWCVTRFAGRQYLAVTRATQGYQGYMGPGWYGHVMLPLEHAFDQEDGRFLEAAVPENALAAVMGNPRLFSDALRDIPCHAAKIQRALNRSVWNGNVSQKSDNKALNPAFSKILLWEISNTGLKTQDVFDQSISNLHQTVVSSILQDSQFQAALAIDIMDRNLYERANDCRWWALSPVFRRALSNPDADALREVAKTLVHINGLYTVYDNLVVFDRTGRALAVSNPKYQDICGQVLNEEWVRRALSLGNSQSYTVSNFVPSPLYQDRYSYIYAAAIREQSAAQSIVGGIGIVFDSAPQFAAMLNDALPRDESGAAPAGCFGVFADREHRIIASTQNELKPGMQLELEDSYFRIANGAKKSGIAVFNGHYYAVGACMSNGYREYKDKSDSYRNDVIALVFSPLGECKQEDRRGGSSASRTRLQGTEIKATGDSACMEIATFYVDSHWLGIPTDHVVESIDIKGLTRVPGSADNQLGYIMFRDKLISVVGLWGMLGKEDKRRSSNEPQIVVLRMGDANDTMIGVMVDELGEIPEIPLERIEKVSPMLSSGNALAGSLVKPAAGKTSREMIVVLSQERLRQKFTNVGA